MSDHGTILNDAVKVVDRGVGRVETMVEGVKKRGIGFFF